MSLYTRCYLHSVGPIGSSADSSFRRYPSSWWSPRRTAHSWKSKNWGPRPVQTALSQNLSSSWCALVWSSNQHFQTWECWQPGRILSWISDQAGTCWYYLAAILLFASNFATIWYCWFSPVSSIHGQPHLLRGGHTHCWRSTTFLGPLDF